ncbi:hypothetical protein STXM2123_2991 [Streptomyces sp. F-3]|nr:hypothetical protein STXM2123_2991 [Streptomyces sp. F-3]
MDVQRRCAHGRRRHGRRPRRKFISSLLDSSSVPKARLALSSARLSARRNAGSLLLRSSVREIPDRSTRSEQKSFTDSAIPWFPLTWWSGDSGCASMVAATAREWKTAAGHPAGGRRGM